MDPNDDPGRIEKQPHRYAGYEAYDPEGERIGDVDDLFVDREGGQEYVELNMGFLGLASTIVPMEICTVDDERGVVLIDRPYDLVREAPRKPLLGDDVVAITPDYEDEIREYFEVEGRIPPAGERTPTVFSSAYSSRAEALEHQVPSVEPTREEVSETEADAEGAGAVRWVEPSSRTVSRGGTSAAPEAGEQTPQETPRKRVRRSTPSPQVTVAASPREERTVEAGAGNPPTPEETRPAAVEAVAEAAPPAPATVGGEGSADDAQTPEVGPATGPLIDPLRFPAQALAGTAAALQWGNLQLTRGFLQAFVGQLQAQAQGSRAAQAAGQAAAQAAAQALAEGGLRQQQALQSLAQQSVNAYSAFLSSAFSLYGLGAGTAAQAAQSGTQAAVQAASDAAQVAGQAAEGGAQVTAETTAEAAPVEAPANLDVDVPVAQQGTSVPDEPVLQGAESEEVAPEVVVPESVVPEEVVSEEVVSEEVVAEVTAAEEDAPVGELAAQEEAAAPSPATEPVELPPAPQVPNVADELPPPPEVPPVDLEEGPSGTASGLETAPPSETVSGSGTASGSGEERGDERPRVRVIRATPAARRLADEMGLVLADIEGTGRGGQITASDVRNKGR